MTDTLHCQNCEKEIESTDDLERVEAPEVEPDGDGGFSLHGNDDLFLCRGCKKPMGVGRRTGDSD